MSFGNGWNLTHGQWQQLYLLEWLHDRADGKPNHYVTTDRTDIGLPYPSDANPAESLADAVSGLRQEGLVSFFVHTGPVPNVPPRIELTRAGVEAVQEVRRRRADPAARRPAARDALLRWLYESASVGFAFEVKDFWDSTYTCFLSTGGFFTTAEVDDASRWLRDHGYVTAGIGSNGSSIPRLAITLKGEGIVESDRSTSDDRESAGDTAITITDSPGAIVANRSAGAHQASFVTMTEEAQRQIRVVADYLEQVGRQLALPEQDAERLPELASNLREIALEPAPDRGKLKRLLESARELAVAAASIPLGAGLQAIIDQALRLLGLG